jgi:hypothetical protein
LLYKKTWRKFMSRHKQMKIIANLSAPGRATLRTWGGPISFSFPTTWNDQTDTRKKRSVIFIRRNEWN